MCIDKPFFATCLASPSSFCVMAAKYCGLQGSFWEALRVDQSSDNARQTINKDKSRVEILCRLVQDFGK